MVDTIAKAILLSLSTSFTLPFVEVVSSHVCEQVGRPAAQLLADKVEGCCYGSLLGELVDFMEELAITRSIIFSRRGDEDHVSLEVTSGLVVFAMRDLPRKIWHQQSRMAYETDSIVESLAGGERLVSAFVGQDPQSSTEKSLHERVDSPQTCSYRHRWYIHRSDEAIREVEDRGQGKDVPHDIAKAPQRGSFETVFGYSFANVLDGVVWEFEGVAKCVDEFCRGRKAIRGE